MCIGVSTPPLKNNTPLFLAKTPFSLQTVQAPLFTQSPHYIGFSWTRPPTTKNQILNISDLIYFLSENCNPPEKSHAPLSQQPTSKSWGPVKPPPFLKFGWRFNPPPSLPSRKEGVHTMLAVKSIVYFSWSIKYYSSFEAITLLERKYLFSKFTRYLFL